MTHDRPKYQARVAQLEAEGLTTSDAQAVADAESGTAGFGLTAMLDAMLAPVRPVSPPRTTDPRDERIKNLEMIVVYLMGDYIRGEQRGGSMEWEDLDATHSAACTHFPDLLARAEAENPAEPEPEDDGSEPDREDVILQAAYNRERDETNRWP